MSLPNAQSAIDAAREAGLTVAVAESLTGGAACAALVDVPGASAVVAGGIVAYDAALKVSLLGVPQETLDTFGPVSEEVALAMAEGVRRATGAALGVSTTGAAGPEAHGNKPPGTVFIGVSTAEGARALSLRIAGDRDTVRRSTVDAVIAVVAAQARRV